MSSLAAVSPDACDPARKAAFLSALARETRVGAWMHACVWHSNAQVKLGADDTLKTDMRIDPSQVWEHATHAQRLSSTQLRAFSCKQAPPRMSNVHRTQPRLNMHTLAHTCTLSQAHTCTLSKVQAATWRAAHNVGQLLKREEQKREEQGREEGELLQNNVWELKAQQVLRSLNPKP
jgi:hypothetical protein